MINSRFKYLYYTPVYTTVQWPSISELGFPSTCHQDSGLLPVNGKSVFEVRLLLQPSPWLRDPLKMSTILMKVHIL